MIIMLIFISIIVCIVFTFYNCAASREKTIDATISFIVCSVIFCIFSSIIISKSYTDYLADRAFYTATKEQYFNAVKVYKTHAEIDMEAAAYTDFKYQGYQENIGKLVISLRNRIIKYNERIIKKRIVGKNLLFSWYVIEPDDDMVIIKMIEGKK